MKMQPLSPLATRDPVWGAVCRLRDVYGWLAVSDRSGWHSKDRVLVVCKQYFLLLSARDNDVKRILQLAEIERVQVAGDTVLLGTTGASREPDLLLRWKTDKRNTHTGRDLLEIIVQLRQQHTSRCLVIEEGITLKPRQTVIGQRTSGEASVLLRESMCEVAFETESCSSEEVSLIMPPTVTPHPGWGQVSGLQGAYGIMSVTKLGGWKNKERVLVLCAQSIFYPFLMVLRPKDSAVKRVVRLEEVEQVQVAGDTVLLRTTEASREPDMMLRWRSDVKDTHTGGSMLKLLAQMRVLCVAGNLRVDEGITITPRFKIAGKRTVLEATSELRRAQREGIVVAE